MERFTQAIKESLDHKNFYAALTLALTLPDICGRLSYPELKGPRKSKERYIKWFDKYLLHHYKRPTDGFIFMSGGDCYALRCALLHEGTGDLSNHSAKREDVLSEFAFSVTESHCGKYNGVLLLNVYVFCYQVCQGVKAWSDDYKDDSLVQAGIAGLLTIHTQGFNPIPGVFSY